MEFRLITVNKYLFIRISFLGEFIIITLYVNNILIEIKT